MECRVEVLTMFLCRWCGAEVNETTPVVCSERRALSGEVQQHLRVRVPAWDGLYVNDQHVWVP